MSPDASQPPKATSSRATVRALVEQFRHQFVSGQVASVDAFVASHEHLAGDKAALLDLAYEEFCAREEAGDVLDREAFCRRFPRYHSSLRRLIATHDVLRDLPSDTLDTAPNLPGPGESILGYAIQEELGRGAFARVCLAADTALGNRTVVIKVSRSGAHEAGILGQLEHPSIVPVHSVQKNDAGLSVVCMPFLGRTTLCDVLDGIDPAHLPKRGGVIHAHCARRSYVNAVADTARQLAEALSYVHAKGIQHRDIKPSNVLISTTARPMLLDFNLATADGALTDWGGTLPYMSPEQLNERRVDGQSDVFSLGVVAYELLSCVHPFGPFPASTRDNLRESLRQRQQHGARDIRLLNEDVPDDLARLLHAALVITPERRPTSAGLAHELAAFLSVQQQARRWVGRHAFALGIYASLLALLMFAGVVGWLHRTPYDERELAAAHGAYQEKSFADAIEHASRAVEHSHNNRTRVDALLVRAKSRLRTGNRVKAAADLDEAAALFPDDSRILVLRGYCFSLAGDHKSAIGCYQRSEYESAAVCNNIGCGYLQLGSLVNAQPALDKAISLDRQMQAAYINRALLTMRQNIRKPGSNDAGRADVEKAIALGPESAELYQFAAWIVMQGTGGHETASVCDYLRMAVELGGDPAAIRNDSVFGKLTADSRFQEALRAVPRRQAVNATRILCPLE